ncbi:hypothetical protein OWR29_25545 [Actinoplanes sp. Pm04-4]|uniref:Uncharacterized protein n=1 Tax=Paractinoplanes pyxinae TaxID=2997416 RepID=A0ABT4B4G3_9ACTN|nr:hypothetical protein [Actinoplanes pyxinae]MCY1141377.1 hypothetical protein [Actinoplanes pyxinae]
MATIKAPNGDYNGSIGDVVFTDGVAETDNKAVIAYCRGAGYEVDGATDNPAALPRWEGDSSKTHEQVGTPLRDAAVDPKPGDFLPPVNAGQADPHSPDVVSPEIHASPGPTPIVPGPVSDDPEVQGERETEGARLALLEQLPAQEVTDQLADNGKQVEPPAGNASADEWRAYAVEHRGATEDEVAGMKRDDLREKYGN